MGFAFSRRPLLPLHLGQVVTILSLGRVRGDKEAFHSDKYIWPIGYTSMRQFTSLISNEPDKKCDYKCEILDGGGKPLFRVTPSDAPHISEVSPSSAYVLFAHNGYALTHKREGANVIMCLPGRIFCLGCMVCDHEKGQRSPRISRVLGVQDCCLGSRVLRSGIS